VRSLPDRRGALVRRWRRSRSVNGAEPTPSPCAVSLTRCRRGTSAGSSAVPSRRRRTGREPRARGRSRGRAQSVSRLPVGRKFRDGYSRDSFRHWNTGADPADGCNPRAEILITEAVEAPAVGAGCRLSRGGVWFSCYDTTWVHRGLRPGRLPALHRPQAHLGPAAAGRSRRPVPPVAGTARERTRRGDSKCAMGEQEEKP
jgi:hypothetical protein